MIRRPTVPGSDAVARGHRRALQSCGRCARFPLGHESNAAILGRPRPAYLFQRTTGTYNPSVGWRGTILCRPAPTGEPHLPLLRCCIGKPNAPIGQLVVVVCKPEHYRLGFGIYRRLGERAHECRSVAPMLRIYSSRRHGCAPVAVYRRSQPLRPECRRRSYTSTAPVGRPPARVPGAGGGVPCRLLIVDW